MWMGVGCPCPPVRNDTIVAARHLFCVPSLISDLVSLSPQSHEITHAFNPDTLQFDEFGQKNNQWSNDSSKVYDAMTEALVQFYAAEKFNVGVDIGGGIVDGKTGI